MFLDFAGGVLLTAAMVVNINAVISTVQIARATRLVAAIVIGLWIGLQVSLASAGAFGTGIALDFPLIGLMAALPLVAVALIAWLSRSARAAMLGLPMTLLIGLNVSRVFGVFFLLMAADGRLGGPFPVSAGWGDVIAGALAIPLALAVARGTAGTSTIWAWNAFGLLDLLVAVGLGAASFNGLAGQLILDPVGSNAIEHLPWALIPTVLVPFYIIAHVIIFAQLWTRSRSRWTGAAPQRV